MKKGKKNFYYRMNPESILSELTCIEYDEWLKHLLNFLHDLRADCPIKARSDVAKAMIKEAHEFREKRSKAGKASAEQRAINDEHMLPDDEHMLPSVQPVAVTVAVTESILETEPKPKVKRFVPPSIEEVHAYMKEIGFSNGDASKWWHHYECKNWMVGKNKMVNWKSAVQTWFRSDKGKIDTSWAEGLGA